jgi:hypothetical protein
VPWPCLAGGVMLAPSYCAKAVGDDSGLICADSFIVELPAGTGPLHSFTGPEAASVCKLVFELPAELPADGRSGQPFQGSLKGKSTVGGACQGARGEGGRNGIWAASPSGGPLPADTESLPADAEPLPADPAEVCDSSF